MSAVRLARGATGRDAIVKFEGCYHGHADALLARGGGSGLATYGLPGSRGVTDGAVRDTLTVPYNDLAAAEIVFGERGDGDRRDHRGTGGRQHGRGPPRTRVPPRPPQPLRPTRRRVRSSTR